MLRAAWLRVRGRRHASYARHVPRRALGAACRLLQASWPVLHTAYRTSQGARRISRAACGTVSHDASCTLRSIFLVRFPAPSSPVPVGTVSTQIATWQACTVPLVGAGGARARCRLATANLVRNVSAINDISWRIRGRTPDVERGGTCNGRGRERAMRAHGRPGSCSSYSQRPMRISVETTIW